MSLLFLKVKYQRHFRIYDYPPSSSDTFSSHSTMNAPHAWPRAPSRDHHCYRTSSDMSEQAWPEACLIPCPLPGTSSTLYEFLGNLSTQICLLPWSPLLREETRLLKSPVSLSKAIFWSSLYYFPWPVYFSKHFLILTPVWFHLLCVNTQAI